MNAKTWAMFFVATLMTGAVAVCGQSAERADTDPATAPLNAAPVGASEGPEAQADPATARLSPAQHEVAKAAGVPVEITNSIGMKLVLIPPGEFMMGSPESEEGRWDDEGPQHRVRLTKPFYLGLHEVTQGKWERVMGTRPWSGKSYVKEGSDYAATYVSWEDALQFCKKLAAKEGREYRLPTEAEWEYGCRAGTETAYHFGDDASRLGDYGWYYSNADHAGEVYAHLVGQKKANGFGLFDMHGNVWEWCADWSAGFDSDYYATSPVHDPQGPASGSFRVNRGGCWINYAGLCRSAARDWLTPADRYDNLGFRVALVPADESSK